jgi:hypothetical protein
VNAAARTVAFAAGVAVAFGAAYGVGRAADLGMPGTDRPAGVTAEGGMAGHDGADDGAAAHDAPEGEATGHESHAEEAAAVALPGGLQVAQDGYRLVLDHSSTAPARQAPLTFRIIGPDDEPLRSYTTTHDKDLHLIAVRRDLTGFQHVHPQLGSGGTWTTRVDLTAGAWRVFADFDPAGEVAPLTLGTDLLVSGSVDPQPLPEHSATATVDDYSVTLKGTLTPGTDSQLTVSVSRDGRPVTDLQPYLAAYGHLVALRQGDLAYLHVHPDGEPGDGRTQAGPAIVFHTVAPSAGTYRLYLDFQHEGVVRTAELTMTAGQEVAPHGH